MSTAPVECSQQPGPRAPPAGPCLLQSHSLQWQYLDRSAVMTHPLTPCVFCLFCSPSKHIQRHMWCPMPHLSPPTPPTRFPSHVHFDMFLTKIEGLFVPSSELVAVQTSFCPHTRQRFSHLCSITMSHFTCASKATARCTVAFARSTATCRLDLQVYCTSGMLDVQLGQT